MRKIISTLITLLIVIWVGLMVFEFFRFKEDKDPLFCLKENIYDYDNGSATECIGLGYKIIHSNIGGSMKEQFGPFWIKVDE